MENKVYVKKRSDNGSYYLELWIEGNQENRRSYSLGLRNKKTDNLSAKLAKEAEAQNIVMKHNANKIADRVFEILKAISVDEFLDLAKERKMSLDEIEKDIEKGKTTNQIKKKKELSQYTVLQYTIYFLERKVGKLPVITDKYQIRCEKGASYTRAVNKFNESLGRSIKPTSNDFKRFIELDINWEVNEIPSNVITDFIRQQKNNLMEKVCPQVYELIVFLNDRNLKLKKAKDGNTVQKNGFNRNKSLCERIFTTWLRFLSKDKKIREVTSVELINYAEFLGGMSKNNYPDHLRSLLKDACQKDILDSDILFTKMKVDFQSSRRKEYLDVDEITKLANTSWQSSNRNRKPKDYSKVRLAFLFATQTGLRYSDCIRITWANIYEDGFLRLDKQKKTQWPVEVPLSNFAKQILQQIKENYPLSHLIFGDLGVSKSSIDQNIRSWIKSAGINNKYITFHSSRHSMVYNAIQAGIESMTISTWLGHSDLAMIRHYWHEDKQKMREMIQKLNPKQSL